MNMSLNNATNLPHDIFSHLIMMRALTELTGTIVCEGVHLILAFHYGQTCELLPPSHIARPDSDKDKDWQFFYINQ